MSKSYRLRIATIVIMLLSSYYIIWADSFWIHPTPHEGYEIIKQEEIHFRSGNAGIIMKPVRGDEAAKYFAERGAAWVGNPFLQEEFANPTIFLVTILNRTNGNATFTPGMVTIRIHTEASFPLEYTTLLSILEVFPANERKILEKSIFHSPEIIKKGDVMTKFLLFPPLPQKALDFKLDFDFLYFEQKEIKTRFYFRQERIREKIKDQK
jgi:hypothetical protein